MGKQVPPLETCGLLTEHTDFDRKSNPRLMPRQWLSEVNLLVDPESEQSDCESASSLIADYGEFGDVQNSDFNSSNCQTDSELTVFAESANSENSVFSQFDELAEGDEVIRSDEVKRDDDGVKVLSQPVSGYIDFFDDNDSESGSAKSRS